MQDIIEGRIDAWEKKNLVDIENIVYSDIRLLADCLRVSESRVVEVIEVYITRRNIARTKAGMNGLTRQ